MGIDERLNDLLNILIEADTPMTGNMLAEAIGMSPRSIQTYIQALKEILESHGYILVSKRGTGFYIEGDLNEKAEIRASVGCGDKKGDVQQKRLHRLLNFLFEFEGNNTLSTLSEELLVSKGTVKNDIEHLNEWMKHYGVSIESRRNVGVVFVGNELFIRAAYKEYRYKCIESLPQSRDHSFTDEDLLEKYTGQSLEQFRRVFPEAPIQFLIQSIQYAEHKLELRFTDTSRKNLLEYISLLLKRPMHPPELPSDEKIRDKVRSLREYAISEEILQELGKKLGMWFDEREQYYLAVCLQVNARQYKDEKIFYTPHASDEGNYIKAKQIVQHITEITGNQFAYSNRENYLPIVRYIARMQMKSIHNIEFFAGQVLPFFQGNHNIVLACLSSHNTLAKILGFEIATSDLLYLAMLLEDIALPHNNIIRAVYISQDERNIARCQIRLLESMIPQLKVEAIIPHDSLDNMLGMLDIFHQDDVLFLSTRPFPSSIYPKHQAVISSRISDKDGAMILHVISDMQFDQSSQNAKKKPPLILFNKACNSLEEAIHKGCTLMKEKGYVTESFEHSVLQREQISTTVLEKGIAIPHGSPHFVRQSCLCVIRPSKPIVSQHNNIHVDLIFLLAAGNTPPEDAKTFSRRVFRLISDDVILGWLRQAKSKEELSQLLDAF